MLGHMEGTHMTKGLEFEGMLPILPNFGVLNHIIKILIDF
jgi:hypothetical protein